MFLVPNIDQMYKEMKKIVEVGNGDEFPDFADLFFFFGIKNVRVGGNILGSIGNTYFFFCLRCMLNTNQLITKKGPTYDIFSTRFVICHLACLK